MSLRCLVTGGAGFIGSHLVERLVAEGCEVAVLDDFSSGREENLAAVREKIELHRGDVRDAAAVARAAAGAEWIFHQAAIASVHRSLDEPGPCEAVNVGGSLCVLEAARAARARRLVLASSCAVYGDAGGIPRREDGPLQPGSPYAIQKRAVELYTRLYAELHGLPAVALRYFNVYGARQNPDGEYAAAVPRFARACLRGDPPRVHGDGEQTRDLVHVDDVVEANLLAARSDAALGRAINVGRGVETSVNELAAEIASLAGFAGAPLRAPSRPGETRRSVADLSMARALLGFQPRVGLREGLRRTLESIRAQERAQGGMAA